MYKLFVSTAMLAVFSVSTVGLADDLKSALQVGDSAGFFQVKDCSTATNKGKSLCYR